MIQLRANHTVHLNAWKTTQATLRLTKFKNSIILVAKAAYICNDSFSKFRNALTSITIGNLYGIADHTTPIYEGYARGAL